MARSVITTIRRKKMAEASHTTGVISKVAFIALGSGGVDSEGNVIEPQPDNMQLKHEIIRKPYFSSKKVSDTAYEYTIKLDTSECLDIYFSELALIDEDGDIVAFSNFLSKGKDDTEVTFTVEDSY